MDRPKFSIIVVCYQRYNNLQCLLYSLLAQTYKDFEVIIIHDGYDIEHEKIASEFVSKDSRFRYMYTDTRYNDWGMSLRNLGVSAAKGEWVINTNDDNYYVPIYLNELADKIEANKECNFIYYDCVLSHHNVLNHNGKDYGLLIPQIRSCYIDMGQFAVKSEIISRYKFKISFTGDGELVEDMKHELKPEYIDKILFVHN
jgi:glycosyltransferase involved in cell wall biosynthesis